MLVVAWRRPQTPKAAQLAVGTWSHESVGNPPVDATSFLVVAWQSGTARGVLRAAELLVKNPAGRSSGLRGPRRRGHARDHHQRRPDWSQPGRRGAPRRSSWSAWESGYRQSILRAAASASARARMSPSPPCRSTHQRRSCVTTMADLTTAIPFDASASLTLDREWHTRHGHPSRWHAALILTTSGDLTTAIPLSARPILCSPRVPRSPRTPPSTGRRLSLWTPPGRWPRCAARRLGQSHPRHLSHPRAGGSAGRVCRACPDECR